MGTQGRGTKGVAVVTGASRGLGQGIALELGAAGYTVYITGRSKTAPTGYWAGTLDETAAEIDSLGGKGIPVTCDHADDSQTEALFKQIEAEQGRLDILVNNAFGMPDDAAFPAGFWERPLDMWEKMIDVGLRSSYVASWYAAPMMIAGGKGLIVNTSSCGSRAYLHTLPYGLSKTGQDKLAHDMAHDLRPHNVAAISFWHGLVKTERTLLGLRGFPAMFEHLGGEKNAETPRFGGRLIDALYHDPDLMRLSGGTFYTAELARHYGIKDIDGGEPGSFRPIFGPPLFEIPLEAEAPAAKVASV